MKPKGMPWTRYVFYGFGRRLSLIGERLGIQWLTYNPVHFWHFHEHAVANAPSVIDAMMHVVPFARRVLDVGAGSGGFAAEAKRRGLDVAACENSAAGRKLARAQGLDVLDFDLTRKPPAATTPPYDLAYCFEVAEHLPQALGESLVLFLTQQAPVIIFSAAHPGQGGTGHINEQPKEYWIQRFERHGYSLDKAGMESLVEGFRLRNTPGKWFHSNVIVVRKGGDGR
jgi:SAM-dependent methyltransferase